MKENLEIKLQINSYEEIIKCLKNSGADFKNVYSQKDTYYKNNFGLLKLRDQDNKFQLIRYIRDESKVERWSDYDILEITDDNAGQFFSSIFEIETIVIKQRTLYLYKNTRIHLDNVEQLGKFIELETVVQNDRKAARTEFDEVVSFLQLDTSKQMKCSYRDLMLDGQ